MKSVLYLFIIAHFAINPSILFAQNDCPSFENKFNSSYPQCIHIHRQEYILDFLKESRSPIKAVDTAYFDFYKADVTWWIDATFQFTPDSEEFQIATSNGSTKPYKQYAKLFFDRDGAKFELDVYQSLGLIKNPEYSDYLFMPFMDLTNGETSYEGGRYIDLKTSNFGNDGHIQIDFNRAYNPYCAFSGGYSCPVPPKENRLKIGIYAGEKKFKKPH